MTVPPANFDTHQLLLRVRELIQSIDGYVHLTLAYRRKINTAATLPDRFYTTSAMILDDTDWLVSVAKVTADESRQVVDESAGLLSLAGELELLAKGLRSTAAARRGDVGERLLLMYNIARQSNRSRGRELVPHIDTLRDLLRKRRRKGAAPAPESESTEE